MNKAILILIILTILFANCAFAEEGSYFVDGHKKIDLSFKTLYLGFPNTGKLVEYEPENAAPSGAEFKITFPFRNRFKYSIGTGSGSHGWSMRNPSFFGGSNTVTSQINISMIFFEFIYLPDLGKNKFIESNIGIRYDQINISKSSDRLYDDSSYTDKSSSFSGSGYIISLPIEIRRIWNSLIFDLSYAPGIINVPVSGEIDGTDSSTVFKGSTSNVTFGITFRID